jgi:hypothetical protein
MTVKNQVTASNFPEIYPGRRRHSSVVEQRFCKPSVLGSNPSAGFFTRFEPRFDHQSAFADNPPFAQPNCGALAAGHWQSECRLLHEDSNLGQPPFGIHSRPNSRNRNQPYLKALLDRPERHQIKDKADLRWRDDLCRPFGRLGVADRSHQRHRRRGFPTIH